MDGFFLSAFLWPNVRWRSFGICAQTGHSVKGAANCVQLKSFQSFEATVSLPLQLQAMYSGCYSSESGLCSLVWAADNSYLLRSTHHCTKHASYAPTLYQSEAKQKQTLIFTEAQPFSFHRVCAKLHNPGVMVWKGTHKWIPQQPRWQQSAKFISSGTYDLAKEEKRNVQVTFLLWILLDDSRFDQICSLLEDLMFMTLLSWGPNRREQSPQHTRPEYLMHRTDVKHCCAVLRGGVRVGVVPLHKHEWVQLQWTPIGESPSGQCSGAARCPLAPMYLHSRAGRPQLHCWMPPSTA